MFNNRLHLILVFSVIFYFVIILSLLKKKALNLKYSLLWLFSGVILGLLVTFPRILIYFVNWVGIQTPMYGLIVFCLAFIIAILLSITSIVSRQNRKIRTLIQENALLEKRIRDIEKKE